MKTIKIASNDQNIRLDNFICKLFPNMSLANVYKAIRTKNIKVNNKRSTINYKTQLNDVIEIYVNDNLLKKDQVVSFLNAKDIIDIIYQDDNIIVVNKPDQLLIYDEKKIISDTLINRVKKYLYINKKWDYQKENHFEPSLVHRLDFNTTGLVIIAKNHEALTILNQKIKDHEIDKYYLCMVHGQLKRKEELLQNFLIKDDKKNIVKILDTIQPGAVLIKTHYKVLSYDSIKNYSILEIKLITGKTHQIRSHLAYIGYPLVGEQKYSNKNIIKDKKHDHQALVAYKIIFNFITDAGILNYLNNKTIELSKNKIIFQ